jgi:hypothetical protein
MEVFVTFVGFDPPFLLCRPATSLESRLSFDASFKRFHSLEFE